MVTLKKISMRSGQQQLLNDISCELMPGSISVLLGASGAGKTTLLRVLASLAKPDEGAAMLDGVDLGILQGRERATRIGFMPQGSSLFPGMTVLEQCVHPLMHVLGLAREQAEERSQELLRGLDMEMYAHRYPENLSGGQQQRVALARLLAMDADVLLLDEPTSALDPANTARVVQLLQACAARGKTVILSTQDMPFAQAVATQALFLRDGQLIDVVTDGVVGRIAAFGS